MTCRLLALALTAVVTASPVSRAAGMLEGTTWTVTEIAGKAVTDAGTLEIKGGAVSGHAACNRYRGSAKVDMKDGGGTVTFGPLATTRMMCQGKMELEKALLDALAGARGYRIEGSGVVLTGAEGAALVRLAP